MPVIDCPDNNCDSLDNPLSSRLVWVKPTDPDTNWVLTGQVIPAEDKIIGVRLREQSEGTVFALDLETGKTLWEWGDPYINSGYHISRIHIYDNQKVIVETWSDLFIIDINTGQTIWSNIVKGSGICGSPRSTLINDHIYYTLSECGPAPRYNFLMRTPISHFAPDTLFKIYMNLLPGKDSGWISSLEPPVFWKNQLGDSILIFQDRPFRIGVLDEKVDLYALNLRDRSILWKIDSVAPEGSSSVFPPFIENSSFYFAGGQSLNKIDLNTGKVLWRYKFTLNSQTTHLISPVGTADHILMHPANEVLYAINKQTGQTDWKLENIGLTGPEGGMALHNNIVTYIAAPELYEIDYNLGKVVQHYKSPNEYRGTLVNFSQFARTIKIPNTNYIFTSDERFGMLIRTE